MDHIEFAMLASVTASQSEMRSDFEVFKGELTNVLNKIVDDQNILNQELFIIRQKECESSENITKIDKSIANLTNIIKNVSKSNVFQDQSQTSSRSSASPPSSSTSPPPKVDKPVPKKQNDKKKIQWVGTSISKALEEDLDAELTMVKA